MLPKSSTHSSPNGIGSRSGSRRKIWRYGWMAMRKKIPRSTETAVLTKSRRRCALCFHISGDLTEQVGQIAHLDENPANGVEDNLVWLCLPHHSLYDSTTSQHKNYTLTEVRAARNRLYKLIEDDQHLSATPQQPRGLEADRKTLADILAHMQGYP